MRRSHNVSIRGLLLLAGLSLSSGISSSFRQGLLIQENSDICQHARYGVPGTDIAYGCQAQSDEQLPFIGNGSFGTITVLDGIVIDMPPSTGCQGSRCSVKVTVQAPLSAQPWPVVIVSPGFMTSLDRYESYAQRLTSWGYVAVRWEAQNEYLPVFVNSHATLANMVHELIKWVSQQSSELKSPLHGAKINSLLAAWNVTAIPAVVNLDPVDISGFDASDDEVLPILSNASAAFLNIGSQLGPEMFAGTACAPKAEGYAQFYKFSRSPAWMFELLHAGHMQFLDEAPPGCISCQIMRALCVEGPLPDWLVRQVSQTAMIAWLKHILEGVILEPYQVDWANYLDSSGVALSHYK